MTLTHPMLRFCFWASQPEISNKVPKSEPAHQVNAARRAAMNEALAQSPEAIQSEMGLQMMLSRFRPGF